MRRTEKEEEANIDRARRNPIPRHLSFSGRIIFPSSNLDSIFHSLAFFVSTSSTTTTKTGLGRRRVKREEEEEEKMNKKDGWKQPAQRFITKMKFTLNPEIEIEPWFVKWERQGWSKRYEAVVGGGWRSAMHTWRLGRGSRMGSGMGQTWLIKNKHPTSRLPRPRCLVLILVPRHALPNRPRLHLRTGQRTLADKTVRRPALEGRPQVLNRRIRTQPRQHQRPEEVEDVPHIHPPAIGHEAAQQPFHATVAPPHDARGGVEAFVGAHGVSLAHVGDRQHGGEGVGEVQDAEGGDGGGEADEVGDAGADDEGDDPVDGDEDDPGDFAGLGDQGWGVEDFDEDVVVDDC